MGKISAHPVLGVPATPDGPDSGAAMLIKRAATYREIYDEFRWDVPARFNMAVACCDRWATDPHRIALIHEQPDGAVRRYSFAELQTLSNQCANMLVGLGLQRTDRVLILLGQRPEAAILHLGAWRSGMVTVLCSVLFGADSVGYRVRTSDAKVVVTDDDNLAKAIEAAGDARVVCVDGERDGAEDFWALLNRGADTFATVDTASDDPAFICFTSGTTGPAKGALHAHRPLIGHMPCIEMQHDFFPQPGDVMWSPADWAWIAGLMDVLMPAWFHGVPVLAFRSVGFDPEQAFHMMAKHHVTTVLLVPTMLRLMKQVPSPRTRYDLTLRSLISGGEAVGAELIDWASATLDLRINEIFGQTECNLVLGHNAMLMPPKPGSLGRWGLAVDGRPRPSGRGRLLLVSRSCRRRDHLRGLPDRPGRNRRSTASAPGGPVGRRNRGSGSGAHGDRQSLSRPRRGLSTNGTPEEGDTRVRQDEAGSSRISARHRVRRQPADDHHREDRATRIAGSGTREGTAGRGIRLRSVPRARIATLRRRRYRNGV